MVTEKCDHANWNARVTELGNELVWCPDCYALLSYTTHQQFKQVGDV